MAVSAEALALAWARTERGPAGAVVVVGQEVSPRGFLGRLWTIEAEQSVAMSVILRPDLSTDAANGLWLVAGLATSAALGQHGTTEPYIFWPDRAVDAADGADLAAFRVNVVLGPGGVRFTVVTVRVDLTAAGVPLRCRTQLVEAIRIGLLDAGAMLERDPATTAADYAERSLLTGRQVKIELLPSGQTRGRVAGFDATGALLLGSSTDAFDRIPVDTVRELTVAQR